MTSQPSWKNTCWRCANLQIHHSPLWESAIHIIWSQYKCCRNVNKTRIWTYLCISDVFFKVIVADGENAFWATKLNCFSITHSLINACFKLENAAELEHNTTQLEPISDRMWPLTPAFTFTLKWQNHIWLNNWLSVDSDRPLPTLKPVQYQMW